MKAKRIRWTDDERIAIYERMIELYAEGKYTTKENILRKAQDVLPVDRRRKMYPTLLNQLKGWMERARIESYTRARDRKLTEVALASKVETPAPQAAPQPVELSTTEMLEKLLENLVDYLAKRVAGEVTTTLSERLSALEKTYKTQPPVMEVNPSTPEPIIKPRRKRVLVIGLKGQQVTVVEQKYPDLDFTFMTADEAQTRNTGEADWTVVMTKFINHSVYSKYRHASNLHHCNGGVSDLGTIMQIIRNS